MAVNAEVDINSIEADIKHIRTILHCSDEQCKIPQELSEEFFLGNLEVLWQAMEEAKDGLAGKQQLLDTLKKNIQVLVNVRKPAN